MVHAENTDSTQTKTVNFSIYPAFGYQPETSVELGAVAFIVFKTPKADDAFYRPTSISPYFLYTFKKQILTALDLDIYFKNGWNLNGVPRYYKYPDTFYGIGNKSKEENEEIYTNEYFRFDGRWMKPIDGKWYAGLGFDVQYNMLYGFEEHQQLDTTNLIGHDGGFNAGLGPAVTFDTRDNTLYPTKGSFCRTQVLFFSKIFGSRYHYISYLIDLRKYLTVVNSKNIVAFQVVGMFNSGDDIPFYKLSLIGGDNKLRGIANANLYMDKQSFWTQAEYRRDLFWRLGAVIFAGFGDVAPSIGDFDLREFKYVAGVGGRFQALKDEKFNIRLDIGVASHGQSAFYLSVREAF